MITCKNCETTFEGKFCSNCSQKADTHRFTLKHFLHESFHAFTHADKGILFLIKELFLRPGQAIREYNEGKRKKYFNPITFLLIAAFLQLFAMQKTQITEHYMNSLITVTKQLAASSGNINQEALNKELKEAEEGGNKAFQTMLENNKAFTLLVIPFMGLITWLLFRKSGFNYAENLVMNVMISAQLSILFLFFCALPFLILPSYVLLWMFLFFLINWGYSFFVYKQFFRQSWFVTIIKGIAAQILFIITNQLLIKLTVIIFSLVKH
jgi:hypothetical protein